jgi:very-short-patch-repair endonuclease
MQSLPLASQIAAVARRQHGVVTRQQLLDLGVGRRKIDGWIASGRFERLLPGVLGLAGAPTSREQALFAVVLWGGRDALVSHRSAGVLWGFDGVKATKPEITVPAGAVKRSTQVIVHNTRSPGIQRRTRHGLPTTTPERTLVDLAGVLAAEPLEIAFESARRERHVTVESVQRGLERVGTQGRTGGGCLQHIAALLADEPPCESALEVITARMLRTSDLPAPQRQVEVTAFGTDYRLDFAWPEQRVALECDGRKWHEAAFEADRERWSAITAATGYRIVWSTWQRVRKQRSAIVGQLRNLIGQAAGVPPPRPRLRGLRSRS